MDINPFEVLGKIVRRTYETAEDSLMFSENALCSTFPMNLGFGKANNAQIHSVNILSAAETALRHNDPSEAEHQLNRDLYFSSIVDELIDSPLPAVAHAGLDAIKQQKTPLEVRIDMLNAWDNALFAPPANQLTKNR